MVYLLGPGRANEHADQHILAGTEDIAGPDFFGGRTLTHHEALRAGKRLDLDRLEHGTEIVSTRTRRDYEAQEMTSAERGPAHIWHCSLTLHPDEAALSDETWAALAREFVDEMGFTAASGKAACRWVAVRHGVNAGGGDHIHIAVNLVREDGTKASVWRDWPRAQAACNTLEHRYGLAVVESREHQRGVRGESPDEQAAARRDGQALTDRARLEIALRAAASGARTESEFLLALRGAGVLVRPRYAKGTREHVDGFSVAVRPPEEARPKWIGAYYVARDLRLRRLRAGWADVSGERRKALALWAPQHRRQDRPWVSGSHARNGTQCRKTSGKRWRRLWTSPWPALTRSRSATTSPWRPALGTPPGSLLPCPPATRATTRIRSRWPERPGPSAASPNANPRRHGAPGHRPRRGRRLPRPLRARRL